MGWCGFEIYPVWAGACSIAARFCRRNILALKSAGVAAAGVAFCLILLTLAERLIGHTDPSAGFALLALALSCHAAIVSWGTCKFEIEPFIPEAWYRFFKRNYFALTLAAIAYSSILIMLGVLCMTDRPSEGVVLVVVGVYGSISFSLRAMLYR